VLLADEPCRHIAERSRNPKCLLSWSISIRCLQDVDETDHHMPISKTRLHRSVHVPQYRGSK
jgi:hypothetical protein